MPICIMTGRSRFSGSVKICLLVSQIVVHLFVNAPKLPMNGNLLFLSIAQDQSRPQIDSVPSQTVEVMLQTFKNGAGHEVGSLTKLLNITLTVSLVLLANDVSPNPGPGPSQPL